MCKVKSRYKKQTTVTGYKVVYKYKGRYYSPFTGYQYHVGTIPVLKVVRNGDKFTSLNSEVLNQNYSLYTFKMSSKTGVLLDPASVNRLFYSAKFTLLNLGVKVVVLKMTLSHELYIGEYNTQKTIIGDYIEGFEEINIQECTKVSL